MSKKPADNPLSSERIAQAQETLAAMVADLKVRNAKTQAVWFATAVPDGVIIKMADTEGNATYLCEDTLAVVFLQAQYMASGLPPEAIPPF